MSPQKVDWKINFQAEVFASHSSGIREIQFEENVGLPEGTLVAYIFEGLRWPPFWVNI